MSSITAIQPQRSMANPQLPISGHQASAQAGGEMAALAGPIIAAQAAAESSAAVSPLIGTFSVQAAAQVTPEQDSVAGVPLLGYLKGFEGAGAEAAAAAEKQAYFNQPEVGDFEKIGDYGLLVRNADTKIMNLFDWLLTLQGKFSTVTDKRFIIDKTTGKLEGSLPGEIITEKGKEYLAIMEELAPVLATIFNATIKHHNGHNKLLINCFVMRSRNGLYGFHRDQNPQVWKEDEIFYFSAGLMFAYKNPEDNGPILPTTIAKMPCPPPTDYFTHFSPEELKKMQSNGTVYCPEMRKRDVIAVDNQNAMHATTSPDVAEALLGEESVIKFFTSAKPIIMREQIKRAPILRITCATFNEGD